MMTRRLAMLSAVGALLCCATAARGDDQPIIIREDAILQRMAIRPDGKVVATVGVTHDGKHFNRTVKLRDLRSQQMPRGSLRIVDVAVDHVREQVPQLRERKVEVLPVRHGFLPRAARAARWM